MSRATAIDERSPAAPQDDGATASESRPAGALTGMLRAAIAPVICAAVLVGALTAWTLTGGAGTLRRVHVEVTLAVIPVSFLPGAGGRLGDATTYLDIKNVGSADELIGARSPIARGALLVRDGRTPLSRGRRLGEIALPAGATLNLTPFGRDLVLVHPRPLHVGEIVPITLVFRHAGPVRVDLLVSSSFGNP